MSDVPQRLTDFPAAGLDVLLECQCGAYRYVHGDALGWHLKMVGATDWFYDCGSRLQCPACREYRKTTATAVRRLSLSDWHAERARLAKDRSNDATV